MKKKAILNFLPFILILFLFSQKVISSENEIYEKIDVFGEVLEKINKTGNTLMKLINPTVWTLLLTGCFNL